MKFNLLMTGNELMSGVTVDSNSSMIAQKLEPLNHRIGLKVTIGDDLELLQEELARLAALGDVLIVNGGLGPTQDDLTALALSKLTGSPIRENAEAMAHLALWCERRGLAMNDANRKQAMLPAAAEIVPNPIGSAVGFRMRHGDCDIICTPGVPGELRAMLDSEIVPWLKARFPSTERVTITRFQLFGIGESAVQQRITEACTDWPPQIELGFRAGAPTLELKVSSFRDRDEAERVECEQRIRALFGDYIVGVGDTSLQRRVIELLAARGKRLASAESCTGGLIASLLTEVPGASSVFEAGFVSYSNRMKEKLLGVSAETLEQHGAVSEAVVLEMAGGAILESGADYAVAVSGIAGPDGGTPDKPVGIVWIGWGSAERLRARQLYYPLARKLFQTMVAATALDLLRRDVLGIEEPPRYFTERSLKR